VIPTSGDAAPAGRSVSSFSIHHLFEREGAGVIPPARLERAASPARDSAGRFRMNLPVIFRIDQGE
jgi:hypothetical protein